MTVVSECARHRARRSRHTFRTTTVPPAVHIERVTVDSAPVALTDGVDIAPGRAAMGIRLHRPRACWCRSARSFDTGSRASTRTGWMRAIAERLTTRGSPRAATPFRVTASNNDGVWSEPRGEPALHAQAASLSDPVVRDRWSCLSIVLAAARALPAARRSLARTGGRARRASRAAHTRPGVGQCRAAAGERARGARRKSQVAVPGQHEP